MKLQEKEITIKAPWGKLAALTWGEQSNPPVLLCHGKQDVCSGFRPLVSLLPLSFFYVSVELPGSGKSDHFPRYARYTNADYVPAILAVQKHFGWENFIYIGHSLGALIGKYFDIAYPGVISRMVELDPVPAYNVYPPDYFNAWYHQYYGDFYREDKFEKNNASWDTAPKYTYDKALDLMMNFRGLTHEAAKHVLERSLAPAGEGLFRLALDQRQKAIPDLPLTVEYLKKLYPSTKTPILCILAKDTLNLDLYHYTPFVKDIKAWPNKNYTVKIVNGGHDNHINNPEAIAEDMSRFLLKDLKSKSKL